MQKDRDLLAIKIPDEKSGMTQNAHADRRNEWFVPTFGPLKFRIGVGILFLPYTGMVLAFTVIGGMLAEKIIWGRVLAIGLVYFFGLGIGAHAIDALGSKGEKPWGAHFTKAQLWGMAILSLISAYAIGGYYIFTATPNLGLIALLEGFFLFAYNLEWFKGRFHSDAWFALSWGVLPVLAGFMIQTNRMTMTALIFSAAMGLLSLVEIGASRPYKTLKRSGGDIVSLIQYETILKSISFGVMLLAIGMVCFRLTDY